MTTEAKLRPLLDALERRLADISEQYFTDFSQDVVRTYAGVDQADRGRLAEIVDEEFEGHALDLVVDGGFVCW